MTSPLAQSITFSRSGKVAPNAFLKSAMTERLCTFSKEDLNERGKPTTEYDHLYKVWGEGEIGTIILGNIPIDRTALEAAGNAIIDRRSSWDPVEAFKPVVAASKAHGSLVIGQLTHGGRQCPFDVNDHPVSSGDVRCPDMMGMHFGQPRPATLEEIDELVEAWAYGAEVLYKAGADGAQAHAAHGYLLSQFLSARVNTRTDDYGGSLDNRRRLVFRVIEAIKKRVPKDFIIGIKMNSADFSEGGLTPDEAKTVAVLLEEAGVDLIELSGGTYESMSFEHKKESTKKREGYFVEFSEAIKSALKGTARVCVTGGFRSKEAMEGALLSGATDMVGLARPLCGEPYLCRDLLSGKVNAAKENKVPAAVQTGTAIAQLSAIAHNKPIPDLSDESQTNDLVAAITGKKDESKPVDGHEDRSYVSTEKQE
ncbi:hypothetical protein IAR55_004693 [Kwoniella newhampshirensis]|uniref:NADH:flavin oxidoreductase/NADH oxidase N-terminal domain-containing protein n=1 Tax=Kwoniella newhampshirensis TaxID=1651941 RepID=A0AAW0YIW8_9TREE